MNKSFFTLSGTVAFALILSGCAGSPPLATPGSVIHHDVSKQLLSENILYKSPAGIPVNHGDTGALLTQDIASRHFVARADPFALLPQERSWESKQQSLALSSISGQFPLLYEEHPVEPRVPIFEEQKFRRLAGIVIGDSVTALIDMGDGNIRTIHPGQEIDGWIVKSIEPEQATLRRIATGILPTEITVRLGGTESGGQPGGNEPGGDGNPSPTPSKPTFNGGKPLGGGGGIGSGSVGVPPGGG